MQFRLYGKVVNRSVRKVKKADGTTYDLYNMVIEEPGAYPSRFQVSSKVASLFGAADGPLGIGKFVPATGFINGAERDAKRRDGTPFKSYAVWFTVKTIESAAPAAATAADPAAAADEISDDIPF